MQKRPLRYDRAYPAVTEEGAAGKGHNEDPSAMSS